MGSAFSRTRKRKPEVPITEVDEAVLSLRTQRRKLNGERKRLEDILEKNVVAIKELLTQKQKNKALLALKKKKMREEQLKNLDNWLVQVEGLLGSLEFSQQRNEIFAALRTGADALKSIQNEVRVEDVEKLTAETEDAKAYLDELHEAMGMDPPEAIAELEEELQQLEDVMAEEEKLALPTAPTTKVEVTSTAVAEQDREQPKEEAPLT